MTKCSLTKRPTRKSSRLCKCQFFLLLTLFTWKQLAMFNVSDGSSFIFLVNLGVQIGWLDVFCREVVLIVVTSLNLVLITLGFGRVLPPSPF